MSVEPGAAPRGLPEILDALLPLAEVETRHAIRIAAPPAVVYPLVRRFDLSPSLLIRVLFRMRGMPATALRADGMASLRFKPLHEEPGRVFVMGIIGRFWHPSGGLLDFEPTGFTEFANPGYAKGIWSFDLADEGGGTALRTVTRVKCTDAESLRSFRRYWFLVRPLSGLVRTEMLRLVRRAAESGRDGD